MGEKPWANGEATKKAISQPPTRDQTLLSWFEEAMKQKPRPIEDIFSTAKGPGSNHSFINEAPTNQNFSKNQLHPNQATKPTYTTVIARHNTLQRDLQAQKKAQMPRNTLLQKNKIAHTESNLNHSSFTPINGSTNKNEKVHRNPANTYDNIQVEDEKGWIKVTRKHKTKNKQPKDAKPLNPYLKKRQMQLIAQDRCFKCFEKGHNKAQCRNAFKCHNRQGIGHQASYCTQANRSTTTNRAAQQEIKYKIHTNTTPKTEIIHNNKMDLQNWETMEMLSP